MANSAYGMVVHDDCQRKFIELQFYRKHRFIIYKIEDKQIVVEKIGEPAQTFQDFSGSLPAEDCRYAMFDLEYVTTENLPDRKTFFVVWSPDKAKIRSKMIYASSKDRFKRELQGIDRELHATEPSEMGLDILESRANYRG